MPLYKEQRRHKLYKSAPCSHELHVSMSREHCHCPFKTNLSLSVGSTLSHCTTNMEAEEPNERKHAHVKLQVVSPHIEEVFQRSALIVPSSHGAQQICRQVA